MEKIKWKNKDQTRQDVWHETKQNVFEDLIGQMGDDWFKNQCIVHPDSKKLLMPTPPEAQETEEKNETTKKSSSKGKSSSKKSNKK